MDLQEVSGGHGLDLTGYGQVACCSECGHDSRDSIKHDRFLD
jgi:hypothetical protein